MLEMNKYPWLVGIGDKFSIYCGGTLVASKYVITAAHCFQSVNKYNGTIMILTSPSEVKVWIGFHNVVKPGGSRLTERKLDVVRLIHHDNYETTVGKQATKSWDLTVVELAKAVDLNMYTPACMAKSTDMTTFDGKMATVAGRGSQSESGAGLSPVVPYEVKVPVIAASKCPGTGGCPCDLCAGGERGKDSCRVDIVNLDES